MYELLDCRDMTAGGGLRKINEAVFNFEYQKFRVRVNHTITHNQTQLHKVNYFDFCFVVIKMPPHLKF